ncbi:DSPc domain-containing protein [Rhizoctonia solani AG-1 IA]|uniref:DSPc domain-containing protein n=1 Tax=Thanatephorus cucumeris (strain AG1-IA) TaxID=983506 RepID=L8WUV7_THACA|nr:DSPc domain-containing protein [Rhizoctonia solani AG-1 IA]
MLHALGITHVVSVGECALVPGQAGGLWTEEREGRISVLDIKGVCDDGIDSLRTEIGPVVEWIDRARASGGSVLVHCRVGVSRSATITIAYVMKHLEVGLVDAYLMVRSRRLSVLIQPNMRLLYNLCGWEMQLAKERAKEGAVPPGKGRQLTWPFLAREVASLNER